MAEIRYNTMHKAITSTQHYEVETKNLQGEGILNQRAKIHPA